MFGGLLVAVMLMMGCSVSDAFVPIHYRSGQTLLQEMEAAKLVALDEPARL